MVKQSELEPNTSREKFSAALVEAYNNVREHSNAESLYLSTYQSENTKAYVMFDDGIGIPESIKVKVGKSLLEKYFGKFTSRGKFDERCIEYAIEGTKTNLPYRGKGFMDIIGAIDSSEQSDLLILSGRGGLIFHSRQRTQSTRKSIKLKYPIKGTLIYWQLSDNPT